MKKHYKLTISGRVQGVGFRFSCSEMAHQLNIKGMVKNMDNKDVYVEAEGEEPELLEFIAWCRKGPAWARVADLKIEEDRFKGYENFRITR